MEVVEVEDMKATHVGETCDAVLEEIASVLGSPDPTEDMNEEDIELSEEVVIMALP